MTGDAIEVADLRVVRGGRTVVSGLDVTIAAGTVTGLLGPSGSGKTTLMRALVGVQAGVGGRVTVLGLPAGASALRRRVAYVTQSPSVYGDLTVAQNLRYFARLVGADSAAVRAAVATVGLGGNEGRLVTSLSGGERSRVSLATALLGRPEVLVLDEPTVGLDPVLRRDLWATFHALARSGATLVVSSHVMEEAAECDDLVLLRDGRLVAHATPQQLRQRTGEHDLGRAFLALVGGGP